MIQDVLEHHTIVPDGYNIGRNALVAAAVGTTSYGGVTYSTTAQNITGLLEAGSTGVNHGACGFSTCLKETLTWAQVLHKMG